MESQPLPYCIQVIQAVAPTVVAVIALCITSYFAFAQWNTASNKLRLDLFDRRYAYFEVLRDFMVLIVQNGDARGSAFEKFLRGMIGSDFLFEREIVDYIESVKKRAIFLMTTERRIREMDTSDERNKLIDEIAEVLMGINDEFPQLEQRFSRHMSFVES